MKRVYISVNISQRLRLKLKCLWLLPATLLVCEFVIYIYPLVVIFNYFCSLKLAIQYFGKGQSPFSFFLKNKQELLLLQQITSCTVADSSCHWWYPFANCFPLIK